MRIAVLHNFYQQAGGEDQVFASETEMLERGGHTVIRVTETNDRLSEMSTLDQAAAMIWNGAAYRRVFDVIKRERIQLAHFHNTFILLSPASYYAARRAGAAVVKTLHNFRLLCPVATFLRDGKPCEDCVGHLVPWPGIQHGCYRSRGATAGVAAMLSVHRAAGTWRRAVDAFIAPTEFSKSRFVNGGLPASRIMVKPNFLPANRKTGLDIGRGGGHVLFAARLSLEKGIDTLLDAWRSEGMPPLRIAGDGPLRPGLQDKIRELRNVEWIGRLTGDQVLDEMRGALALVLPSICYEGFPVSIVEAYSVGLPVIVSGIGGLPEIVKHERTGLVFPAGDASSLSSAVLRLAGDAELRHTLRTNCMAEFEELYGEGRNLERLLQIYGVAIRNRGGAI
jgi:glycosyltransferase involved in cell wall biosynthesis